MHYVSQKLFLSTFDRCETRICEKFSRIHFTNTLCIVSHRVASRPFPFRPDYLSMFLSGYTCAPDGGKTASRPMQSFDVSSGCLRPNVKTQAVARVRDRNVNFGSWNAARVVCHGIDRRCSWQLEAALRGRGVSTPSQSFSHFYTRVAMNFRRNARLLIRL